MSNARVPFSTHCFAVVVCRNFDGRWLAVKETRNRGWWLPAGLVNEGETPVSAAHRECREEARIEIELKGILRIEHSVYGPTNARLRVVFFAMPKDHNQIPKDFPDGESEEARWVTLEDLKKLARKMPGLRGPELYEWGNYIEKGGMIAPLHFLCREDQPTPSVTGSKQNSVDLNALISSMERGDDSVVKRMALMDEDLNIAINEKHWTLLHLACQLGMENCVDTLLMADCDVSASTHKKRNVLHFAAQSTPNILYSVLAAACRNKKKLQIVNQQDTNGDTPLHFAAAAHLGGPIWQALVACGADPEIRNRSNIRCIDIANDDLI